VASQEACVYPTRSRLRRSLERNRDKKKMKSFDLALVAEELSQEIGLI